MLRKISGYCIATLFAATTSSVKGQVKAAHNYADRVEFQTFEMDGEIKDMMWCGH